jgi:photosystem II stability/assembly factor-like uncharacterized protein
VHVLPLNVLVSLSFEFRVRPAAFLHSYHQRLHSCRLVRIPYPFRFTIAENKRMKKIATILLITLATMPIAGALAQDAWQVVSTQRDIANFFCMYFLDEHNGWAAGQGIIIHTADGGKSWEKQYSGPGHIKCIYFKNVKDGFAGGESDFYVETHDGGATWKPGATKFESSYFIKIFFVNDKNGFMLSKGSVYRSTDGGASWKNMGPKKEDESYDFNGLAARDASHLVVVGDHEMLYTSADGGATWTQNKKDLLTGERRHFWEVGFKDANTGWISCSTGPGDDVDCLYTTDGGNTWTPKSVFKSYQLKNFNFRGNCGWATMGMNEQGLLVSYDGGATWDEQKVTDKHKVMGACIISQKTAFVGLQGDDFLFRLSTPK